MLLLMTQFHSVPSAGGFYAVEYSPSHLKQTKPFLYTIIKMKQFTNK